MEYALEAPNLIAMRSSVAFGAYSFGQTGVVAATATTVTTVAPPQVKPISGAVAMGATVIGVGADAVEQFVRPDTGQTTVTLGGSFIGIALDAVPNAKLVAPVTNELIEGVKSSSMGQSVQDFVNGVLAEDANK